MLWKSAAFRLLEPAAGEQLRARLSDAFDRFLEGVADNLGRLGVGVESRGYARGPVRP